MRINPGATRFDGGSDRKRRIETLPHLIADIFSIQKVSRDLTHSYQMYSILVKPKYRNSLLYESRSDISKKNRSTTSGNCDWTTQTHKTASKESKERWGVLLFAKTK